ncbi:hypothetical protein PMIN04_011753 [Paraphaeosphaeria minitans]
MSPLALTKRQHCQRRHHMASRIDPCRRCSLGLCCFLPSRPYSSGQKREEGAKHRTQRLLHAGERKAHDRGDDWASGSCKSEAPRRPSGAAQNHVTPEPERGLKAGEPLLDRQFVG